MLTDYHVHLRPDEDDSPAERYFTPANVDRYREAAAERGIEELGVAEHIHRFVQSLDVWTHPWYRHWAADDVDEYVDFLRSSPSSRWASRRTSCPAARTGSPTSSTGATGTTWSARSTSCATRRSTSTAIRSGSRGTSGAAPTPRRSGRATSRRSARRPARGLFDILAHPDLVKVWGSRRAGARGRPAPLLRAGDGRHRESNVAIEVSTAGLRKPVAEIYPAPAFLEMCLEAGGPVALSSDAHRPEQLGYEYERALELLDGLGVEQIAVFDRREQRLEALG